MIDLSGLLAAYQQNQANTRNYTTNALSNMGGYANDISNQYLGSTSQLISQMQQSLQGLTNPNQYTIFNPGYQGVGNEWGSYQNEATGAIDEYARASQLLQQENPNEAAQYNNKYQGFISNYLGGLKNLESTVNQGWQAFGSPREMKATDLPGNVQAYANQQADILKNRSDVYNNISGIRQTASEALARGTQLQSERKQRNLTDRSSYYANQASRNANMVASRGEQRQGSAIQRQRQALGRSASPKTGYLSSMLNR